MWGEIMLALGPTILEAIGAKVLDQKNKIKAQNQINDAIEEQFRVFENTSLACEAFHSFINSSSFVELLRNYFFMIKDNQTREEYRESVQILICEECSFVDCDDAKAFFDAIEVFYADSLHKIIEDYPGIHAAFQLMSISHREIIAKIRDSENELKRYLSTLNNRKKFISDENIKLYHSVAEKEFGEIRFTGIAGAERRKSQNINEFYVENTFSYIGKHIERMYEDGTEELDPICLKNFFDLGNKIILIGGAGLGKSTTLNYLFCNYEKLYECTALKLKIDLKEYAEEIGEKKKGVLWCIANEFSKKINFSGQTMEEMQAIVATKLREGSCLIILDALDEIPTQSLRNTVRSEIETFTSIYYLNRFIISTREVGYLKNRFDETFLHIRINCFSTEQIKKYSKNWYLSYYTENNDFDEFWNKFEVEVNRARCHNLIKNPIVLILALVIFNFENSLPNRRIEFYQKCIDTFLTERENRKAAIKLSEKTKSILAMNLTVPKIAYYRHHKLEENSGFRFNYAELENAIKEAIAVEDEINWITAIKQYSEYLVERTELIQEVDEEHLDFAHKTFYEYFLAFYFCKMCDNQELAGLLCKWIGDSNYDELARLIIEVVIQNNNPKQHDDVMNSLFEMLSSEIKTEQDVPEDRDVFAVLSDLYTHNLLQPKFQFSYHKYALYNPRIVYRISHRFRGKGSNNNLALYDPQIIGDLFLADYKDNKFIDVIDAIYCFNNEFKKIVIPQDSSNLLYRVNELFQGLKDVKRKLPNDMNSLDYFLGEGLEYTLEYPQIFVAVMSLAIKNDMIADLPIERVLQYKFIPTNVFYQYTTPEILYKLVDWAMTSERGFALLLASSIDCGFCAANSIYGYVMSHVFRRKRDIDQGKRRADFCLDLWRALNNSNDTKSFKEYIKALNLYDSTYDDLYERVYTNYVSNEKSYHDYRIEFYLHKQDKGIETID